MCLWKVCVPYSQGLKKYIKVSAWHDLVRKIRKGEGGRKERKEREWDEEREC